MLVSPPANHQQPLRPFEFSLWLTCTDGPQGESLELEESNLRKIPHGTGEPDAPLVPLQLVFFPR